jgi:hypothetical protein
MKVFLRSHLYGKDEIGFDLALISKFVTKKKSQRKNFVTNSFVNGR